MRLHALLNQMLGQSDPNLLGVRQIISGAGCDSMGHDAKRKNEPKYLQGRKHSLTLITHLHSAYTRIDKQATQRVCPNREPDSFILSFVARVKSVTKLWVRDPATPDTIVVRKMHSILCVPKNPSALRLVKGSSQ